MKEETKNDKFKRLAENRVNNALKYIDLLGNLANKSNYDYSENEYKKIIRTLRKSVDKLEGKFEASNKQRFKL